MTTEILLGFSYLDKKDAIKNKKYFSFNNYTNISLEDETLAIYINKLFPEELTYYLIENSFYYDYNMLNIFNEFQIIDIKFEPKKDIKDDFISIGNFHLNFCENFDFKDYIVFSNSEKKIIYRKNYQSFILELHHNLITNLITVKINKLIPNELYKILISKVKNQHIIIYDNIFYNNLLDKNNLSKLSLYDYNVKKMLEDINSISDLDIYIL